MLFGTASKSSNISIFTCLSRVFSPYCCSWSRIAFAIDPFNSSNKTNNKQQILLWVVTYAYAFLYRTHKYFWLLPHGGDFLYPLNNAWCTHTCMGMGHVHASRSRLGPRGGKNLDERISHVMTRGRRQIASTNGGSVRGLAGEDRLRAEGESDTIQDGRVYEIYVLVS
jgi:hypothetical protein